MQNPRGQVELLETIGKGNYGAVYKAKLKKQNKMAAVKVVFLKEDEIKETLLEMEILEKCKHSNITEFFGCFLKGLDLWICMELCAGGAVDSLYRTFKKPLPEDCIASLLHDSLLALEYLHTKVGLIHRDIKSGNILLTTDGQVKLADFGVSADLSEVGGKASTFIGTPYWMAPEVIECDPDDPKSARRYYTDKSDIWSIGITAIEIAEKNPPLSDIHPMQALKLISKNTVTFSKPKEFSKQLVDFVTFCLVKDPIKRPTATGKLLVLIF
ncbi:kinase-like domain-containing protein [Globomyces pollinis-pini]|nr:kinase-like domain-containing protein [Globomyces pollinis-pini]